MTEQRVNWAGNLAYRAQGIQYPESEPQLQALIAGSTKLKALGTRHAFNDIADSEGVQVSLEHMNRIVGMDVARRTVTIEAGVRYGELGAYLQREGFALPNLASLPHISVAGACATGTHGSGNTLGNLATAVTGIVLINGSGERVVLTREEQPEELAATVVGLGALGILSELTLAIEPTFDVAQNVYTNLTYTQFAAESAAITSSAYSVSLFTDWSAERFHQVWMKRRLAAGAASEPAPHEFFGALPATGELHPIANHSAASCTPQLGHAGPWHERLPHFRLEHTPSSGAELQSEYFVAREHAVPALQALATLREELAALVYVTEIRTVAQDALLLSPNYQRASAAFHFTWKPEWPRVRALLPKLEARLAPFAPRPHWAKLFTLDAETLQANVPRLNDFAQLRRRYDPERKFNNAFLDNVFGVAG